MDMDLFIAGKKAKTLPRRARTAFSDAFAEAVERRMDRDADKRKGMERKEARQVKRQPPAALEVVD